MATSQPDTEESSVTSSQQRVRDAHWRAARELQKFQALKQTVAMQNRNPYDSPEVASQKIELHMETMACFQALPRVKIRQKLPEYWEEAVLYDQGEMRIIGLRALEAFQGSVTRTTKTESVRHGREREVEEWDAQLLPDEVYERALNLFKEILELFRYENVPHEFAVRSVLKPQTGAE